MSAILLAKGCIFNGVFCIVIKKIFLSAKYLLLYSLRVYLSIKLAINWSVLPTPRAVLRVT